MRIRELSYVIVFLFIVLISVACTPTASKEASKEATTKATPAAETTPAATQEQPSGSAGKTGSKTVAIPQLDKDGREDSATMGLLNTPPMQPTTHENRWDPKLRQDSCLACHNNPSTGAPTPTAVHYYDNKQGGKIFRQNCLQCHPQQNDTKPAFNRDK